MYILRCKDLKKYLCKVFAWANTYRASQTGSFPRYSQVSASPVSGVARDSSTSVSGPAHREQSSRSNGDVDLQALVPGFGSILGSAIPVRLFSSWANALAYRVSNSFA
jgi:hypothetical protein